MAKAKEQKILLVQLDGSGFEQIVFEAVFKALRLNAHSIEAEKKITGPGVAKGHKPHPLKK